MFDCDECGVPLAGLDQMGGTCGYCLKAREKPAETLKPTKRELLDDDGENRAVRAFLMLYGAQNVTAKSMKAHMIAMGYPYFPDWVERSPGHLAKGGAQLWLRLLFALEDKQ